MKQIWTIVLSLILLTFGAFWWIDRKIDPAPETIVASSLKSLHEQQRLSVFAARFVTVVTTSKAQYGLSAQKTMIVPAMVRYDVDLAKVQPDDLRWNSATKTLSVTLPPIETSGPEFDLKAVQEYEQGAILLTLTDVEKTLDTANRGKAQADVLKQAQAAPILKLARDAATKAVERSFALPLAAAGLEAKVNVEFEQ